MSVCLLTVEFKDDYKWLLGDVGTLTTLNTFLSLSITSTMISSKSLAIVVILASSSIPSTSV